MGKCCPFTFGAEKAESVEVVPARRVYNPEEKPENEEMKMKNEDTVEQDKTMNRDFDSMAPLDHGEGIRIAQHVDTHPFYPEMNDGFYFQ